MNKTLKFAWSALAVCVFYLALTWLLNSDELGLRLSQRLNDFWFTIHYVSVFVVLYASAGLIVLLTIGYLVRWAKSIKSTR